MTENEKILLEGIRGALEWLICEPTFITCDDETTIHILTETLNKYTENNKKTLDNESRM